MLAGTAFALVVDINSQLTNTEEMLNPMPKDTLTRLETARMVTASMCEVSRDQARIFVLIMLQVKCRIEVREQPYK